MQGMNRRILLTLYCIMRYNTPMKKSMSIRISSEAKELLLKLVQHLGISQTAVLELAIRQLAKQENLR